MYFAIDLEISSVRNGGQNQNSLSVRVKKHCVFSQSNVLNIVVGCVGARLLVYFSEFSFHTYAIKICFSSELLVNVHG